MHDRSSGDLQGGDELGGKAAAAWNTATNLAVISRMTDAPAGADTKPTPAGGVAALAATLKRFTLMTSALLRGHLTVNPIASQEYTPP